jgi:succinylglutamic semialdehyde dehydrogenase
VYGIRDRLLRKGDYIRGSFLKPEVVDGYINAINPGDRSDILGRFPFSEHSVDEAVDVATLGHRLWRRVPVGDRATAVFRFREALVGLQDHLAILVTRETGKPLWEARQEVHSTVRMLDVLLEDGLGMLSSSSMEDMGARMDRMARGVVALITPYTTPLLIPASQSAMALLAGNAVVFKPSKFAPGVGQAVADLWDRCRLPRGVFNMVQGSGSVIGAAIAGHPGVDEVLFTGSFETAMSLRRQLFDRPELPAIYQCGGKGIAVALDDAEIDRTIYEVLVGAFLTAGQRYNSTGRLIVTDAVYSRLVPELVRRASRLRVSYGFDPDAFMGPLVSENHRTRYRRYGRALSTRGHTALLPANNERHDAHRGFYVKPAIYDINWENGSPFLNDEPAGPLLLVYRVRGWEEAVALHNQATYRPVTSLFTRPDNPVLPEIEETIRSGGLNVNRGTLGTYLRLPRVGLGRASSGQAEGLQLLYTLSYPRTSLVELRPFNPAAMVPGVNWNVRGMAEPGARDDEEETEEDLDVELLEVSSSLEPKS